MRVALISPGGSERNQQEGVIFDIYEELEDALALLMDDVEFIPNLALLSLAGFFDGSWDVKFIEEDYLPAVEAEELLFGMKYDLACISIVNYTAQRGYEISDRLKKSGVYTAIGGLHASALPNEATLHCDTVFVGEAEETFPQFLNDFKKQAPRELYKSGRPADLSKFPPPRYELIPYVKRYNKMPVLATRGCPHKCEFCVFPSVYGNKFRHRPIESVLSDIKKIKKIHPSPYIHFCDENLLCDKEFARDLVKALSKMRVPWECFCDIGIAEDERLLDLLKESRCEDLLIGLETPNPETMKDVDSWKLGKVAKYADYIKRIQSRGIPVTGLFIIGFDNDGKSVFKAIRDFIANAGLRDMDFAVLTPIPGSALYTRLKQEGRIISEDWSRYTWTHVNFQPMRMAADELQEGLLWLFSQFASPEMLGRRERGFF